MAKRPANDPRDKIITVSMTAEQWDSVFPSSYHKSYASDHSHVATETVKRLTEPGRKERRALALAEVEAGLPVLDRRAKAAITRKARTLRDRLRAGELDVDHLGHGPGADPGLMPSTGFDVRIIPRTHTGPPAFHFSMRSVWFEASPYPLRDTDYRWFLKLAKRLTPVIEHWGGPPATWVSVMFDG